MQAEIGMIDAWWILSGSALTRLWSQIHAMQAQEAVSCFTCFGVRANSKFVYEVCPALLFRWGLHTFHALEGFADSKLTVALGSWVGHAKFQKLSFSRPMWHLNSFLMQPTEPSANWYKPVNCTTLSKMLFDKHEFHGYTEQWICMLCMGLCWFEFTWNSEKTWTGSPALNVSWQPGSKLKKSGWGAVKQARVRMCK